MRLANVAFLINIRRIIYAACISTVRSTRRILQLYQTGAGVTTGNQRI